jgi:hypothetical protein
MEGINRVFNSTFFSANSCKGGRFLGVLLVLLACILTACEPLAADIGDYGKNGGGGLVPDDGGGDGSENTDLILLLYPKKTAYAVNDAFTNDDLRVSARYADGATRTVPVDSCGISNKGPYLEQGPMTLTVSYQGASESYNIYIGDIPGETPTGGGVGIEIIWNSEQRK